MARRESSGPDLPEWIQLAPGEDVLLHELPDRGARLGAYLLTLGLFEVWRRRTHFIVTTQRLLAVRGLISRDQQVIPLAKVRDVSVRPAPLSTTVWVSTVADALGTQPFGPLGKQQAERFAKAILGGRRPDLEPGSA